MIVICVVFLLAYDGTDDMILLLLGQRWWIGSLALRIVGVVVPSEVAAGRDALLQCHYDLEGSSLYALKWYKGSHGKHLGPSFNHLPSFLLWKFIIIAQQSKFLFIRILSIHTERSATRPDIPLVYHHYSSCKLSIFLIHFNNPFFGIHSNNMKIHGVFSSPPDFVWLNQLSIVAICHKGFHIVDRIFCI